MNNIKVRTKLVIVMVIALIALALCAVISNTSLSGLGNNALDLSRMICVPRMMNRSRHR